MRCGVQRTFSGRKGQTLILVWRYPSYHGRDLKRNLKGASHCSGNTVTVLSAMVEDPTGYGRIIRDADGNFVKSVEHKDCDGGGTGIPRDQLRYVYFDTKELRRGVGSDSAK